MIVTSVDEMTIVVLLSDISILARKSWMTIAESMIRAIVKALGLIDIFGEEHMTETGKMAGYTHAREYGSHPFYFQICMHEGHWKMGVALRFSAQALAYYRVRFEELYGCIIQPYEIIQLIQKALPLYIVRLSRIDLCADYINEAVSVQTIADNLNCGLWKIQFSDGKKNPSRISYYSKGGEISTVYIGSKVKNNVSLLRIYDKRLEQLQTHGTRLQAAAVCDSWVRFENQIRGKYAHSITSELMKMESPEQLETMIAACITNKYTFIATDGTEASVTTALKKLTPTASYEFRLPKYRDMSLTESLHFLTTHAGLLPFLYKASLFNPNAIDEFSDYLKARMSTYIPNHDVTKWVKEHSDYYSVHGLEDLFETGGKENDS